MNRKSFLATITGFLAALFCWTPRKKKPFDPKDLPWRRNSNPVPITFPEAPTNEPLKTVGIHNYRGEFTIESQHELDRKRIEYDMEYLRSQRTSWIDQESDIQVGRGIKILT